MARWAILIPLLIIAGFIQPLQRASARSLDHSDPVPRFEWGTCNFSLPEDVTAGVDAFCGHLFTLERNDDPDGPVVRLAVLILTARTDKAKAPPLVVLHGGPGGSSIDDMAYLFKSSPIRDRRDIILIDQRGAGYSEPKLDCPEVIEYLFDDSEADEEGGDNEDDELQALQACKERLIELGIDVEAYTTEENAADIEDLRNALGYDKIDLYGVSYGVDLAVAVMSTYPSRIRSVILDSPVPQVGGTDSAERASLQEIIKACNRNSECRTAFPELAEDLQMAVDRLDEEPFTIHVTNPKTEEMIEWLMYGDDFSFYMAHGFLTDPFITIAPMIINEAGMGRYSIMDLIFESFTQMVDEASWGTNTSVRCASNTTYFTANFTSDDAEDLPVGEQIREDNPESDECSIWLGDKSSGNEAGEEKYLPPPLSIIPSLVLSGRFDPLTTPDYGHWIAEQLPGSTAVTIENAGHGTIGSSTCVDTIMAQFLDDPSEPVDLGCTDKLSEIDFLTPEEIVRLPILEIGLGILRRSPLTISLVGGFGISWVILVLGAVVSATVLPTIWYVKKGRRIIALTHKWEKLHRPATPWLARIAGLVALIAIAFIDMNVLLFLWGLEYEMTHQIKWGITVVCIIVFPAITAWLTRWLAKKIWFARRLIRRAEKLPHNRIPWLVRKTPLFCIGAAVLITLVAFIIFVSLLFLIYNNNMGGLFGYLRSTRMVNVFLGGAIALCLLGTIGTVIGWRRSNWLKARKVFQTVISTASIIVVGSISLLVILGHF